MSKILVIEDNEINRDMLSRRLTRIGFEVSIAIDSFEGIEKAHVESPDLILMDLNLSNVDGWEATATLKKDPQTTRIPVIALTTYAVETGRQKAIDSGCDDFATKPIQFKKLLEKIHTQLSRSQA